MQQWEKENIQFLFKKPVEIHTSDHHIDHILGHLRAIQEPRYQEVRSDIEKHIQAHQMMLHYIAKKEQE